MCLQSEIAPTVWATRAATVAPMLLFYLRKPPSVIVAYAIILFGKLR